MKRSTKAAKVGPAKKLIARKLKSTPKSKAQVSFKSAEWYARAARSFGLSVARGATSQEFAELQNRPREPNAHPGD